MNNRVTLDNTYQGIKYLSPILMLTKTDVIFNVGRVFVNSHDSAAVRAVMKVWWEVCNVW